MALTKQDIALFEKEAMNTDNPIQLRRQFADAVGITIEEDKVEEVEETISVSSKVKKPKAKKAKKAKKKKMSKEDLETTKSAIKKHTGKTEAECEEILERYKASQKKAKSRTSKLKKQGKTIKGTDEKTAAAVVDTAATKVGKKIKKEVQKAKTPAKKAATIDKIVRNAISESKKLIKNLSTEVGKQDKSDARVYLLAMQKEINNLLKKYNDGGMVQGYDIQEGLISVGNNVSYAHGGSTQGYNDKLDESLAMRRGWGEGKKQSYKDRRDESKGMLKSRAHRAYSGVGTMDENIWKHAKGGEVTGEKLDEVMDIYKVYAPDYWNNKRYSLGMIEALYKHPEYHENFINFIKFAKENDIDDMDIQITLMHDIGGLMRGEEMFTPRVAGYKKGGKTQGYDDRQDESLGSRRGKQSSKKVSSKGRRDDSYGKWGKRDKEAKKRLEELRKSLRAENISYGELSELESLSQHIDKGDVELREAAGMPEHKKGGWVQEVVDSPKFRTGAFTKKAEKRGLTPEQFMRKVLSNPSYYDERTRQQAQFMENIGD